MSSALRQRCRRNMTTTLHERSAAECQFLHATCESHLVGFQVTKRFNHDEIKCAQQTVHNSASALGAARRNSSSNIFFFLSSSSWAASRIQARICLRCSCLMSSTPPVRISQWRVSGSQQHRTNFVLCFNKGPPVTGSKLLVSA